MPNVLVSYHNDFHPFESCIRAILADSCVFAGFGALSPSIVKQFGRIKMFEMTTNAPTNVHIAYSSVNENTEPVDILVVSDISSTLLLVQSLRYHEF